MPPSPSNPSLSPPIPDEDPEAATLPLPLSASLILTSLPQDATAALAKASDDVDGVPAKVTIRFQPVGSAPQLRQKVFKISSANRFESVVGFLSRKLKGAAGLDAVGGDRGAGVSSGSKRAGGGGGGGEGVGGVFCYVNSVFAPGLDEGVGGLWRCFKTDDQLIVSYSMTPAFG